MKRVLLAALALAGAASLAAAQISVRVDPREERPDSAWIMDHVRYLADPRCEGRGVGTKGIGIAADYLEKEFRDLGLGPAGTNGSYRESVEVVTGVEMREPTDLAIGARDRFLAAKDFQPLGMSASGDASSGVVFAGYGITAPEFGYDDYAGVDVHDKFVLVLAFEPGEMDPTSRFDGDVNTAYSEIRTKAITAREHGALGLLVVTGPRYHDEDELPIPRPDAGYMSAGLLAAQVRRPVADRLLAGSGWDLARVQQYIDIHGHPKSLALADTIRLRVSLAKKRAYVDNIVGVLRGADTYSPIDSVHAIVIGAHYDHLGLGSEHSLAPKEMGKIHFGADDNASGTAAMLSLAKAWTSRLDVPRHDLVFVAFAGEELGLLGSARYVQDPPRVFTDAMINFDMVGRLRDRKLIVMGTGTGVGLDTMVSRASRGRGFELHMTEDGYGPSDHSSFYKEKIPVLAFFTGAHVDYHKPSDTWDKLNGGGIAEIADYAYALSESLDARPPVDWRQAASDPAFRRLGGGSGFGAYLGTIPDYTQTEGGVKLSDVRDGSPAQAAGVRGGDVLVSFDAIRIDNIYDFTYALRTHRPGQKIVIGVVRGGQKMELTATLGKRGEH